MAFRGEVDLTAKHPGAAVPPGQLTHLAVLQVPVTLLDLGVAVVQRDVPHNLKHLPGLDDLQCVVIQAQSDAAVCMHASLLSLRPVKCGYVTLLLGPIPLADSFVFSSPQA